MTLMLYGVSWQRSTKGTAMSIIRKIRSRPDRRSAASRRRATQDIGRALSLAPTRASREELLLLLNR